VQGDEGPGSESGRWAHKVGPGSWGGANGGNPEGSQDVSWNEIRKKQPSSREGRPLNRAVNGGGSPSPEGWGNSRKKDQGEELP